jgi:phosphate starvation-inducible PhoH-like protein
MQEKNPKLTQSIKRKVKQNLTIKYKIQLNEEQKEAKRKILENKITVLTGKAGSGKTQLAIAVAIDLLFKGEIKKIYITRPVVTREEIGFLPGGIEEKLDPFLIPIYDCLKNLYADEEKVKNLLKDKTVEICPIAYMRGRTIADAVLVVDEVQNMDIDSIELCLTRLGKNGKIILCGDEKQVDLKANNKSGLGLLANFCGKINGFICVRLLQNHRDPIVDEILREFEILKAENELKKVLYRKAV